MEYTGDVVPGGPSQCRRLAEAEIRKMAVSEMNNNVYLITCLATGAQLLIDAAREAPRILALVAEGSPTGRLDVVATTHRHADHIGALPEILAATGARPVAGAKDAKALDVAGVEKLYDGDLLEVGDLWLEVIGLRGHTPGSIALALTEPRENGKKHSRVHLFTGDSLFPGGLGNTDRDPERFEQLYQDVHRRIFKRFGDDTWVYPGHGPDTTLGAERPHLKEWKARGW